MLAFEVQNDLAEGLKKIRWAYPDQLPFAVKYALNETAKASMQDVKEVMPQEIINPTPFTINSLRVDYAKDDRLEAQVLYKDFAPKGTPAGKYLSPIIEGGDRRFKRFERALQIAGLLPQGLYAVPAKGAPLNAYGNLSGALYSRILSYLRASPDAHQDRTARSQKRNKRLQQFFVIKSSDKNLPLGIYQRLSGRTIKMIIAFVKKPHYGKRFHFYEKADATAKLAFPKKLQEAADIATKRAQRAADRFVSNLFRNF